MEDAFHLVLPTYPGYGFSGKPQGTDWGPIHVARAWRAGIVSDALFGARVVAVVLVLLGGTTWATDGLWAADGAYSRFISPVIAVAWVTVVSGLLYARGPATARQPELAPQRAATPVR